jgi:hypothetical protein
VKQMDTPALYWGKQDLSEIPDGVITAILNARQYIDLTAGSAQVPYHFAKRGIPIAVNDRNPYAAMCHRVTMTDEFGATDDPTWLSTVEKNLDEVEPAQGWIAERSLLRHSIRNSDAEWLDGVCQLGPEYATGVARALVKNFRADDKQSWASLESVERETLRSLIGLAMAEQWMMRKSLTTPAQTSNADVHEALETLKITPGAVCYVDPAWPWAKRYERPSTGYEFYTYELGGIVTQKDVPPIEFWSADDPSRTLHDVASWIHHAFENGAGHFIVSTQSTNDPEPSEVYRFLTFDCGFGLSYTGERKTVSSWDGEEYTDHFGIFTCV